MTEKPEPISEDTSEGDFVDQRTDVEDTFEPYSDVDPAEVVVGDSWDADVADVTDQQIVAEPPDDE